MYVTELTSFFAQEATVSSCQPTRLKLWAESFGQQPVWWVTNIQSILDCNFTPFQYLIDTQLKIPFKSFQLAKEAARHNMGPDPALAADPASYHEL